MLRNFPKLTQQRDFCVSFPDSWLHLAPELILVPPVSDVLPRLRVTPILCSRSVLWRLPGQPSWRRDGIGVSAKVARARQSTT